MCVYTVNGNVNVVFGKEHYSVSVPFSYIVIKISDVSHISGCCKMGSKIDGGRDKKHFKTKGACNVLIDIFKLQGNFPNNNPFHEMER